ncbi:phosphoribulokinase/uridine kinase [Gottschalkia purinilytica]|uniref:Phosphoribulokinase/uridine kinase n=2 Tax=Gottschalkia purinilytica TaxID=1503 RepID=A0A0L0WFB0_GOTPU|nr:phosphoribulokinase/uridine kinase [Gottschalkia purinilytica]
MTYINWGDGVMEEIKVIVDNESIIIPKKTLLKDILKLMYKEDYKKYLGAVINNEIKHLDYPLEESCNIEFIDIQDNDGLRIYTRTLTYIYIKACKDLFENCEVTIEHSLSKGIYTELHKGTSITEDDIRNIKSYMKEIIEKDMQIIRELINIDTAINIFEDQGMYDKIRLLKQSGKDKMHIYNLDNFINNFYGYLAPYTGIIEKFDLIPYGNGIILQHPIKEHDYDIPEFKPQNKLANIFRETEKWANILDIGYVGALNDKVYKGEIGSIIRISEALHEKKIAHISDEICKNEDIKLILIAGPTSSGKTTFARRLDTQLKVNCKDSISISLDDYFVDRENTPIDENGEYDFESIDAIDLDLFNKDLVKILEGEEIEIPKFNFITGKREYCGNKIKLDKNTLLIIEGIHGLNEILTASIPKKNKFKIYISSLTQLNIDSHNRIHTTDTRLIRRIVRDYKYRGNDAERTLELWDSVRRGEERGIFPFQEEADAMFNSSLVYELSILKKYAEPLLKKITKKSVYYRESKRLLKFLSYFKTIENEDSIPCTSIIKEFIGGSCY